MLIAVTSPIGIFNVSDVKPEFKSIDNFYFETLSNDSISDPITDPITDPIRFGIRNVENFKTKFWNKQIIKMTEIIQTKLPSVSRDKKIDYLCRTLWFE